MTKVKDVDGRVWILETVTSYKLLGERRKDEEGRRIVELTAPGLQGPSSPIFDAAALRQLSDFFLDPELIKHLGDSP